MGDLEPGSYVFCSGLCVQSDPENPIRKLSALSLGRTFALDLHDAVVEHVHDAVCNAGKNAEVIPYASARIIAFSFDRQLLQFHTLAHTDAHRALRLWGWPLAPASLAPSDSALEYFHCDLRPHVAFRDHSSLLL